MSIANSVDALAVGFGLGFFLLHIALSRTVVGIAAFGISILGFSLGNRIGKLAGNEHRLLGNHSNIDLYKNYQFSYPLVHYPSLQSRGRFNREQKARYYKKGTSKHNWPPYKPPTVAGKSRYKHYSKKEIITNLLFRNEEVAMEVYEAIESRRSIRKYKADPIDDATLYRVLEAGRLAPSWDNTQCWRFIVVRDTGIKSELAGTLPANNPACNAIKNAPVVIVACARLGESGYLDGKLSSDKGDWYMFDVALAMQNMVLEAQSLGLGTVYVGWFNEAKATEILEIPEGHCILAMTPLGFSSSHPKPMPRKSLEEIISYDKFGQNRKL